MNIIKNSKTLKVFLLFTIVLSFFIAPNSAFASERANYLKDQLVSTVFAQGNVYQAQRGSADNQFIRECDSSYSQISINNLYGTDSRTFIYQGEVPNIDDNSYKDGSNYKYRHLSTDWMGGTNRIWWNGNLNDGKGKSDDETDKKGWKRLKCDWEANNHVKDLHAYALTKQGNALNIDLGRSFNDFAWNILASLNGVCSMVTTTLISIANFDVLALFNKIGFSAISNMISKLVIGENYNSPIFYIAILCFLISIICMIVQFIKSGNASFGKIISEFGIFIVALVIMAASLNGNFSKVINSTNNLVSQISSDLSASSSASTQLYVNSSGKPLTDTKNNQIAITMKPYIDTLIERQFGYTVDELDIYKDGDDSVSNKNWGVATTQEMKTLIENLNSANTDVIFDVRTKTKEQGGFTNGDQPNLGYFWYAACSTTNYQDPFTRDYANKKISLNQGDDSVLLYMTDLLAEIDAQNDSGSEKCQNIMRSFHEGTGQGSLGSLILCILVTCCLALALVMASAYCLFGKVLFVGGMVLMPFIGICMLITKTRKIAKSLAITWLNGLIKMLVGMLYVSLIIYISAAVCSAGVLGKVLDIALLIAAFKFGPQLLAAVANAATEFTGGSNAQMGFANNFDRGFNNFANKFGGGHGVRLAEQAYLRGKKGEMGDNKSGVEKYLKNGKKDANEMINNFSNGNGKGGKDDGSGVGIGGVLPVSFSGDERRELNDNLEAVDHEYEKKINAVNLNSVLDTDGNKFKSNWNYKMFHAVLAGDGDLK